MCSRDLERQNPQTVNVLGTEEGVITPFGIDGGLRRRCPASISVRTAQFVFLCLHRNAHGQHAIRVPCFRPTKSRPIRSRQVSFRDRSKDQVAREKITYEPLNPLEMACESDDAIYTRLKAACFQHQHNWKQWVPFYGIVDVFEFQFLGAPDSIGRIPIHMRRVDIEKAREEANQALALVARDLEFGDNCSGEWHSKECGDFMEISSEPCVMEQAETGRQRKKKLDMLYLLRDCARNPGKANGLRTLEGLAQESCILDGKAYQYSLHNTEEVRGLQFILGWQTDRLWVELPVTVSWTFLGVAVIWLCVIILGSSAGFWDIAMAVGQLLAASMALLICKTTS